MTNKLPHNYD